MDDWAKRTGVKSRLGGLSLSGPYCVKDQSAPFVRGKEVSYLSRQPIVHVKKLLPCGDMRARWLTLNRLPSAWLPARSIGVSPLSASLQRDSLVQTALARSERAALRVALRGNADSRCPDIMQFDNLLAPP